MNGMTNFIDFISTYHNSYNLHHDKCETVNYLNMIIIEIMCININIINIFFTELKYFKFFMAAITPEINEYLSYKMEIDTRCPWKTHKWQEIRRVWYCQRGHDVNFYLLKKTAGTKWHQNKPATH